MLNTEAIIKKAQELKAAQDVVQRLENELRELSTFSLSRPPTREEVVGRPNKLQDLAYLAAAHMAGSGGLPSNKTLPEKVKEFLDAHPTELFTYSQLMEHLDTSDNYLRSTLSKMATAGEIRRAKWGAYCSVHFDLPLEG